MAKRKRMAATSSEHPTGTPQRKRNRKSSGHPHGEIDYDREYRVRAIIDERATRYHIDWEPDEETGEDYPTTWEPKENVNQLAIDDWERKKALKQSTETPKKRSRGRPRKRKVIESSSPVPEDQPVKPEISKDKDEPEPEIDIQESQGAEQVAESPLFVRDETVSATPEPQQPKHLEVQIGEPPGSWQAGAYTRYANPSQKSISESPQQESSAPATEPKHTQESSAEDISTSQLVPDSQHQGYLETSTWRGFSPDPTQRERPTQTDLLSTAVESATGNLQVSAGQGIVSSGDPQPAQTHNIVTESASLDEEQSRVNSGEGDNTPENAAQSVHTKQTGTNEEGTPRVSGVDESSTQSKEAAPAESPRTDSVEPSQESVSTRTGAGGESQPNPTGTNQETSSSESQKPTNSQQNLDQEASQSGDAGRFLTDTQHDRQKAASFRRAAQESQDSGANEAQQVVVIDSSTSVESPGQFLAQPDFQPPPAGQRPPLSSNLYDNHDGNSSRESQDEEDIRSQSEVVSSAPQPSQARTWTSTPFQFQTQVEHPVRPTTEAFKVEENSSSRPNSSSGKPLFQSRLHGSQNNSPLGSSFPSIPSYSLPTIGRSAPATPQLSNSQYRTPPRQSMDPSSMPTPKTNESLGAKLRTMRERRKAKRTSQTPAIQSEHPASSLPPNICAEVAAAARASPIPNYLQDGTRSPSAVPAMEHEPVATKEEMNTSERYGTLLPQAQESNSEIQGHNHNGSLTTASTPKALREPNEDPEIANVHVVPVSLANHQGDQYRSNIYHHKDTINEFLKERSASQELLVKAEQVIERLRDIAIHPDLVNFETLSQVSTPERQKQWDVDCSGKFRFLDEFLAQTSDQNLHIAVVAKGIRVPDMLETFLEGSHVVYTRAGKPQGEKTGLRVTVIDIDNTAEENVEGADIVIAMDGNIDSRHPIIRKARRHDAIEGMTQTNSWAMLLTLVAPQTIEHIERCMATNMSEKVRVRVLLDATLKMRLDAGRAEDGQASPKEAASTLADFLDDPENTKWPLGELSQIEDLDSQTETELDQSSNDVLSSANAGDKRPFDPTGTTSPDALSKRPRLDDASQLPATINPQDIEVTHISDSVNKGTQQHLVEMTHAFTGPSETERHLQEVLESVQDRLEQHVQALADLQYRHEAQRNDLVTLTKERDDLITRIQQQVQRMTLMDTRNTELKAERTLLKDQLDEANRKLLDHSVPERREFETLRLATEAAQLTAQKAEKRAETAQKDLEFTRSMYQDSSNRARELAEANADLEARLKAAEILASGEQARVKRLSQDTRGKALERENAKLKIMMKEREAGLKFKDEEIARLKEAGRGRIGTRQSSVPRSPRLGSPVKMGRGVGSRQASPSAGELPRGGRGGGGLHPLRNG